MINNVKDNIYTFFKNAMAELYPDEFPLDQDEFSEKIFWRKSRDEQPQKPFIILDDIFKGKINKAFEKYKKNGLPYQRENWGMTITFGVYTQGTAEDFFDQDTFASDCIEAIEFLFNSQSTFDALLSNGIIVKEKEISDIRDLSRFEQTNYSYRYEVDVVFNFDKIIAITDYGEGQVVNTEIEVNNDDSIKIEQTITIE